MDKNKWIKASMMCIVCCMGSGAMAQKVWDVDSCMAYAVAHNRTVTQRRLEESNYKLDRVKAIGSFLPGISGSTGFQYNYGRNVDPQTNTYNDVSTFSNSYGVSASMPIFQGGSLINQVRKTKANILLGKAALQEAQDNTALETFQAYIDALYYYGTTRLARHKLADSDSLLYKTQRQEELGLKGQADVAQMEAQKASDAYNLTKQSNLYETAMLTLRQKMNLPEGETLLLDTLLIDTPMMEQARIDTDNADDVWSVTQQINPTLMQAAMRKQAANMDRKIAWANVVPTISFFGGISSSYYKELHNPDYPTFSTQFKNNFGSYFGVSMSIPIFTRLSGVTGIRKAQNNYRIACEQYEAQKEDLRKLVDQAVQDREGYLRESIQMEKKVTSDSIAYHVTQRKFEEGLMTSLDVQNNSATLLESKTLLLQSKLTYIMKCRLVEYYKGEEIIKKVN